MSDVLHTVLAEAADRRPDGIAVLDGERALTYRELDAAASRVAHLLAALGVQRGDRVGLYLEKSAAALTGLYGVLKAGAAYVPLAPDWPAVRVSHVIRHAGIRVLLTGADRAPRWAAVAGSDSPVTHLVCLDAPGGRPGSAGLSAAGHAVAGRSAAGRSAAGIGAAGIGAAGIGAAVLGADQVARQPDAPPDIPVRPGDLAYVLYTSGSTGGPKGVMLTHRNALSFVDWAVGEFGLTDADRLSSHAPLHFDLSVFDLFAAARAAAPVVLVPREAAAFPAALAAFIAGTEITVWYSVPSALNMLAARGGLRPGSLPALRLALFAGEVFPVSQLRRAMSVLPGAAFCNLYGPTETNVCTWYPVPRPLPEDCGPIPIGKPITGARLSNRTDDGRAARPGELGELWVAGPTVMAGYLGDPQLTAKVLAAPDPLRPDVLAYRTGDMVTQDEAGQWHFAGRRDSQIKSRGYRIELGEVEAALSAHPHVAECAVVAVPDPEFGNQIRAYVVADDLGSAELTGYSRQVLPTYMVPWSFRVLPALPRTSTGKVDYQALKARSEGSKQEWP